ncbi:MFS general substrate transporter [Rhizoclosmatium globosum]|uniref:Lysosomal dipeptide transporter MFSD1 n=1 Tax=Rhizoclosmatium globosum TaxID=329046 RepID=A0A1Y2CAC1_9FUNG|nr:MFS general substrate transporter [Rhizoclosmatium globosum]|eukprot:ORY43988.1 MFS general substrate transporter [Rhizoclosmatium globosum]
MHPIVLFLVSILQFGTYFAYDAPASLNIQLQKYLGLEYAEWQYILGQMYVWYSVPNVILPFFGGKVTDRFGCRHALLTYSLVNVGLFAKNVKVVLVGRFIFGIGGESVSVARAVLMAQCFDGKSLLFATAMNGFVSKIGSIANAALSPVLKSTMESNSNSAISNHHNDESTPLLQQTSTPTQSSTQVSPAGILDLPRDFWIICGTYILFGGPYYCFNNTALDFLVSKWYPNDTVSAGFTMSIPSIVQTSLLAVAGSTLSASQSGSIILVLSLLSIMAAHILLGFTSLTPIREEVRVSNGKSMLGMAYGICTCLLNIGLVVIPLCVAWILTSGGEGARRWELQEIFYATMSFLGALGCGWLVWTEWKEAKREQRLDEVVSE